MPKARLVASIVVMKRSRIVKRRGTTTDLDARRRL